MSACCRWRRRGELKKCRLRLGAESHHSLAHTGPVVEKRSPSARTRWIRQREGGRFAQSIAPGGKIEEPFCEVLEQ